jgi:MerR family transcriptional regulator, repressor of the yfmOP operon
VTATAKALRIGELASLTGTTPRTIRYYEEIGLLGPGEDRRSGAHRVYDEADVQELRDVLRLKELLGVSLEELREIVVAERARAALRSEWHEGTAGKARQRDILTEALGYAERQLELVQGRRDEIARLEAELEQKVARIRGRLEDLSSR